MGAAWKDYSAMTSLIISLSLFHFISLSSSTLHYSIPEERPEGFLIANIKSDAELKEGYMAPSVPIVLSILPGPSSQYFTINPSTGSLKVSSKPIDRDKLCTLMSPCVLSLEVAVTQPSEHFRAFEVKITVEDINDNAPTFAVEERGKFVLSILESAEIGIHLDGIPMAKDPDLGKNGVQSYSLLLAEGNETFQLQVTEDFEGNKVPVLVLKNKLDRESVDHYDLTLLAYDGGVPPKSGALKIRINVLDVNDNAPEFLSKEYNVSVRENAPAGTLIIKIKATDLDTDQNSQLDYSFSSSSRDLYGSLFSINSTTGDIRLGKRFNAEYLDLYALIVIAWDGGLPRKHSSTRVNIHVIGANSHPPVISINAMSPVKKPPEVAEGKEIRSFVSYISVSDADRGINSMVDCFMTRDEDFSLELIHPQTYKLVTSRVFDRERESSIRATVVCKDAGLPSQTSSLQFNVIITDINDHAPKFDRSSYEARVTENNEIGARLLQVSATDADEGQNAQIRYSLIEYDDESSLSADTPRKISKLFSINPDTGIITASFVFDHETLSSYRVVVVAEDIGLPVPLSSTALLTVRIENINDCPPIFSQSSFSFGIFENLPRGTEVGTVFATDMDSPPYNDIRYSLINHDSTKPNTVFNVDSITGRITTMISLDREHTASYYLQAVATDSRNSSLSSSASVTIYVADKNDNTPVIDFPTEHNKTIEVSSYAPRGYIIGMISAHDLDIGANAKLTFIIKPDIVTNVESISLFSIDHNKGAVIVNGRLDDVFDDVRLIIEVSDQGSPRLSSSALLNIKLNHSEAFAAEMHLLSSKRGGAGNGLFGLYFDEEDGGTQKLIIIIFAAVTGTLVLILVASIIYVCHNKRRAQRDNKQDESSYNKNNHNNVDFAESTFVHNVDYEASLSQDLGMGYDTTREFKMDENDEDSIRDFCPSTLAYQNSYTRKLNNPPHSLNSNTSSFNRIRNFEDLNQDSLARQSSLDRRREEESKSRSSPASRSNLWNSATGETKCCGCNIKSSFPPPLCQGSAVLDGCGGTAAALLRETDVECGSACTTNLSNSDSGRGNSEEEDPPPLGSGFRGGRTLPTSRPSDPFRFRSLNHVREPEVPPDAGFYNNPQGLTTFKPSPVRSTPGYNDKRSGTWQHSSSARSPPDQPDTCGRSMESITRRHPQPLNIQYNEDDVINENISEGTDEDRGSIWLPRGTSHGRCERVPDSGKPPSGKHYNQCRLDNDSTSNSVSKPLCLTTTSCSTYTNDV